MVAACRTAGVVIYRRRATPLHSARAGAGCAYCLALAIAALLLSNPIVLAAVCLSVIGAGAASLMCGRQIRAAWASGEAR